ncbi:MAG: hypothetical protein MZU84_02290 [Sphingobacterium sp.]|nr:hypothetical protein [Sphingobacterium sp.]
MIGNRQIRLFAGEKVNYVCPAVDVTMLSLVRDFDTDIVGIILTGMGRDGAKGIVLCQIRGRDHHRPGREIQPHLRNATRGF